MVMLLLPRVNFDLPFGWMVGKLMFDKLDVEK